MQTVVETPSFLSEAKTAGMTDAERTSLLETLASTPDQGVVIKEMGGFRKFRFAAEGRGKSGSYRIVTFYSGPRYPVFLITVFAKGETDNLTKAERNALEKMSKTLIAMYAAKSNAETKAKRRAKVQRYLAQKGKKR